ncbi:MAG: ribonuclease III domain-containing protein [bacterium]
MIQNSGESLAYLGDCFYELEIRKYLISLGITKVDNLHKNAIKFTSAVAQADILDFLLDNNELTEDEISVYKRGRNSNHTSNRRKISRVAYQKSTGFEAVIGFLQLSSDEQRAKELIRKSIEYIRSKENGEEN